MEGGAGKQAGGGAGGAAKGGGYEADEASLLLQDAQAPDRCSQIPAGLALGEAAQPRCQYPFPACQLHWSRATRRLRGLICIEVTHPRPIAAPLSGPGIF